MKFFSSILFLWLGLVNLHAQVFEKVNIKYSAEDSKVINIVLLGDGYKIDELSKYIEDSRSFTNTFFNTSPFKEYKNYFNVYAIEVASAESGADHPGTGEKDYEKGWPVPIQDVDTYFNSTYDSFGQHFLLFYEIDGKYANKTEQKVMNVLADKFPHYDQALILVNSQYYGGSGGRFAVSSTGTSAHQIAIHELGHSLFDLKDEYYPGDLGVGEAINMTQETDPELVRWKNWLNDDDIGIYPYGDSGEPSKWFKPRHQGCKMELLSQPFCAVCKEGIIEKIHELVSPINTYSPTGTTINNPTFPIDFELNLIKPEPNTLVSSWLLNSESFNPNSETVTINESNLNIGENILTTVITDNIGFLRVDNHDMLHVYTVTWTINYSTLGIEDISSQKNKFEISLYPNPVNDILSLKVESQLNSKLKVEFVSLDGKKVKSTRLSNLETKALNVSNLSQGIYIINFYADQQLIASKKIAKN